MRDDIVKCESLDFLNEPLDNKRERVLENAKYKFEEFLLAPRSSNSNNWKQKV